MESKANKTLLSWTAPEFVFYPKTRAWFLALGIIAAGLFITAILIKNYFFALLIPLAIFLIYVQAKRQPRRITIEITEDGIDIKGSRSFKHQEIISFWIFEKTEIKILSLETKKFLQTRIGVLIGDQDVFTLRSVLKNFIKEKEHEEQFSDIIARRLKF